jgi:hypothetical protein
MFSLANPLVGIVRHGTVHQLKFFMQRPSASALASFLETQHSE